MKKQKRLLLLDGDIFAFQAAAAAETVVKWTEDFWSHFCSPQAALAKAVNNIEELIEKLEADDVVFCLTDSYNWRLGAMPSYKSNRKEVAKPMCLNYVKDELAKLYPTFKRPSLEADDVMGILSTWDNFRPEYQKVIVSIDKDMQTISGYIFNPRKDTDVRHIPQAEADFFWHVQALAGDMTDGYSGCPNIGVETAKNILAEGLKWEQYEHVLKTGSRKGQSESRWRKVPADSWWEIVVSCYIKAGMSEQVALENARVARICRYEDYDMKNKKVRLWQP